MQTYDFFGTTVTTDSVEFDSLVRKPLLDAARVVHLKTCPNHENEINPDEIVSLLSDESRAISFIISYWKEILPENVIDVLLPVESDLVLEKIDAAAQSNTGIELSVDDAVIAYGCIISLNDAINMRNNLYYVLGLFGVDDDDVL